jgi:phospholipase/carboxylesterase
MTGFLEISGPSRRPRAGGAPRQLVVLLHGLGADGDDLIALAEEWAPVLPHAEFVAPHAPFACDMAGFGRQWFSVFDRDPQLMAARLRAVVPILDTFIDQALAERALTDRQLAVMGFSQGTMVALHLAPRRRQACAGVLGYSGALLAPEALLAEVTARPPVLLIYGDADEVVPFQAMAAAEAGLRAAGFAVRTERRRGLGHGIDAEGLRLGARFLGEVLRTGEGVPGQGSMTRS